MQSEWHRRLSSLTLTLERMCHLTAQCSWRCMRYLWGMLLAFQLMVIFQLIFCSINTAASNEEVLKYPINRQQSTEPVTIVNQSTEVNYKSKRFLTALELMKYRSTTENYELMREKLMQLTIDPGDEKMTRAAQRCSSSRPAFRINYVQNYPYVHNEPQLCRGQPFLLIAVHSNAKNLGNRAAIRRTWGSLRYVGSLKVELAFFLGMPSDDSVQKEIDTESRIYRDIVQLNYVENYRNLTIKHLAVYEWILQFCDYAKFLAKVDDDTFVDIVHVVSFLQQTPLRGFYCSCTHSAKPHRIRRGFNTKWTVTMEEYPDKYYPTYCEGLGYLLPVSRIADLYLCSMFKKFFWIDDVHVTGVLSSSAGVPINRFWRGHSYTSIVPSLASEAILDYMFLTAEHSELLESVWHKLWHAVMQYSLDTSL